MVCAACGEEGADLREADAVVVDGGGDGGSGGNAAQAEDDRSKRYSHLHCQLSILLLQSVSLVTETKITSIHLDSTDPTYRTQLVIRPISKWQCRAIKYL